MTRKWPDIATPPYMHLLPCSPSIPSTTPLPLCPCSPHSSSPPPPHPTHMTASQRAGRKPKGGQARKLQPRKLQTREQCNVILLTQYVMTRKANDANLFCWKIRDSARRDTVWKRRTGARLDVFWRRAPSSDKCILNFTANAYVSHGTIITENCSI